MNFFKKIIYSSGCHQLPERSFFIRGKQFPFCSRCTGVLLGQTLMIIFFFINIEVNLILTIVLIIPMGIDWSLQYFFQIMSNNIRRLITGILAGFGAMGFYFFIGVNIFYLIFP